MKKNKIESLPLRCLVTSSFFVILLSEESSIVLQILKPPSLYRLAHVYLWATRCQRDNIDGRSERSLPIVDFSAFVPVKGGGGQGTRSYRVDAMVFCSMDYYYRKNSRDLTMVRKLTDCNHIFFS